MRGSVQDEKGAARTVIGLAISLIEPLITIFNTVYCERRGASAPPAAASPTNLEKIVEIGAKPDFDLEMPGAVGVIAKTYPLIADSLPKKFGAFDRDGVARQRNDAIRMHIRIGEIH